MLCRACRKDLGKDRYSAQEYAKAVTKGVCTFCLECASLPKARRKLKSIDYLSGLGTRESNRVATGLWRALPSQAKQTEMNRKSTSQEQALADALKEANIRFQRQAPFACYWLDFRILPMRLAVEVDGKYHEQDAQIAADSKRTAVLERNHWTVLRFTNEQVESDIASVVAQIIKVRERMWPSKRVEREGFRKMSREEIERGTTKNGSFTKKRLAEWGIRWPPKKGWKEALMMGADPNE